MSRLTAADLLELIGLAALAASLLLVVAVFGGFRPDGVKPATLAASLAFLSFGFAQRTWKRVFPKYNADKPPGFQPRVMLGGLLPASLFLVDALGWFDG
jgi:hypothetical protein